MNPIEQSLIDLRELAKLKYSPIDLKSVNFHELREQKHVFHNLSVKNSIPTAYFPEAVAIADFEWLCEHEGGRVSAGIEVSRRKPFCGQFIGITGNVYVWFGDGFTLCSVGEKLRTVICHNAAADRPMISESYEKNTNKGINFFDTMSAHLLLAGVGGQQSWAHTAGEDVSRAGGLKNLVDVYNFWGKTDYPEVYKKWAKRGSVKIESKEIRAVFYKKDLSTVLSLLPELMNYGISDVEKLADIYPNIHKAWLENLPAKESQYFYLKRAKVNYSLAPDFDQWFKDTEAKYQNTLKRISTKVTELADSIANSYKAEIDLVCKPENLSAVPPREFFTKGSKYTKLQKKYSSLYLLHKKLNPLVKEVEEKFLKLYPCLNWSLVHQTGYPDWFGEVTAKTVSFQLLLKPQYKHAVDSFTSILYGREIGFHYMPDSEEVQKVTSPKKGINTKDNCKSLFAKDFLEYWENGTLTTESEMSKEIVKLMSTISYWTSVRKRLAEIAENS